MEQPKDYAEIALEAMFEDAYKKLTGYQKTLLYMANHIFLTIASSLILGYLAGMTFGKFW